MMIYIFDKICYTKTNSSRHLMGAAGDWRIS